MTDFAEDTMAKHFDDVLADLATFQAQKRQEACDDLMVKALDATAAGRITSREAIELDINLKRGLEPDVGVVARVNS